MSVYAQLGSRSRLFWGRGGLREALPHVEAVVIVDVLSFSTCVDVAVGRGACVAPFPWKDARAEAFAASRGARLAGPRGSAFSLSPASLASVSPGTEVVLPSPNGATLSAMAAGVEVFAGCLRNASAVAEAVRGKTVAVIAAGERWPEDSLRPALEDLLGAGAILAGLDARSVEAEAAVAAYRGVDVRRAVWECASGRELVERGFAEDVEIASMIDVSTAVPRLSNGAFRR